MYTEQLPSHRPVALMYPAAYTGISPETKHSYIEDAFRDYCVDVMDEGAVTLRKAGKLGFLSFSFNPTKTHTEGILQQTKTLAEFQHIHDQLLRIFGDSDNKQVNLAAFFTATEPDSFYVSYDGILKAFRLEQAYPPYTRWFNGLGDAKCKIQKGQITPRAQRPLVYIPSCYTYANSNECWTAEGMSIIYQEENDIQDIKECQIRECQLRILKVTPGGT